MSALWSPAVTSARRANPHLAWYHLTGPQPHQEAVLLPRTSGVQTSLFTEKIQVGKFVEGQNNKIKSKM